MSSRYWNWPQSPSMSASKYLKYGAVSDRPFEPGQRYRNRVDMETQVRDLKKKKNICPKNPR